MFCHAEDSEVVQVCSIEEPASRKRSQEPPDMLPARKKRKSVDFSDIAWGEETRPVCEGKQEFLKSGPDSSTMKSAKQTELSGS